MPEITNIPLSQIARQGGGKVIHQGEVTVVITASEQWAHSAYAHFALPAIESTPCIIALRLQVESGALGIGWMDQEGSDWVSRTSLGRSSRTEVRLTVPQRTRGGKLVFENATADDRPAVALLESITIESEHAVGGDEPNTSIEAPSTGPADTGTAAVAEPTNDPKIVAIPLSLIEQCNSAAVTRRSETVLIATEDAQWSFAAQARFVLAGLDSEPRMLRIRAVVEQGILGVGWLLDDDQTWIARASLTESAAAETCELFIPQGTPPGKLVFDNWTPGGNLARAFIARIEVICDGDRCLKQYGLRRAHDLLASYEEYSPTPSQISELERHCKVLTFDELLSLTPPHRDILTNFAVNVWEYAHGKTILKSYPWNISLPVADVCNARCTFCTSWLDGRKVLDIDKLDVFEPALRNALFVGLVGHGEPMAHPRFDELCARLQEICDPIASVYTITNGFFLEKWRDDLARINLDSYSISLNAATAHTHDMVMGLGVDAFPRIVESIGQVIELGRQSKRPKNVYVTMVVTRQNIAEIPGFIELGNRLGVTEIWLRSLLPQPGLVPGLNYHEVPPYLHPDFERLRRSAVAAIRGSQVPVQADPGLWGQKIFSDTLEEQILLSPPPTISREQALRDRDLRHRNEYLYHQEKGIFRGRPLDKDATSEVRWTGGRLDVVTPGAAGAYAATVPISYPAEGEQALDVEVEVDCRTGIMGLGLLDEAKNEWLDRAFVQAGSNQTAALHVATIRNPVHLVFHNGGDDSSPAQASVGKVRVKVEGIGQALPVEWGMLRVHNAPDPLDDGTNPLAREPRFACKAVYYNLYINEFFYRVNPCCYLQQVPGFEEVRLDGDMTLMGAWNSPAMVELRRRLVEGPLFGACMRCPEKW